jgi:hypothetical protein
MLHIIILGKNYFPEKLSQTVKAGDKVIIIASPDGSIPVSAYKDEALRNMEVKLLPQMKDTGSADGKNAFRIAQALLIGQLTASSKEFEIYTDDSVLLKAIAPYTASKNKSVKKKNSTSPSETKAESRKAQQVVRDEASKMQADAKDIKDVKDVRNVRHAKDIKDVGDAKDVIENISQLSGARKEKRTNKVTKAEIKTKPAKLPTSAEVKRILGAANSSFAKAVMEVLKKSNQITLEMDLRMKLAEAGMEALQCKELARTLNEEFGRFLPASM